MAEHDVKLVVDPAISDADELCTCELPESLRPTKFSLLIAYFDDGNTVSTGLVRRRPSVETMITAVSRQGSHASSAAPSVAYPHAPVNSPETQSVASGLSRSLDSAGIAAKLQAMRVGVTAPPGSAAEKDEGKAGCVYMTPGNVYSPKQSLRSCHQTSNAMIY